MGIIFRKLIWLLSLTSAVFVASQSNAQSFNDEKSPCRQFRESCMAAGFKLRDKTPGNTLIGNCMLPLVSGKQAKSPVTGRIASLPASADRASCKAHISTAHVAPPAAASPKN